jgi:hypothetical protein
VLTAKSGFCIVVFNPCGEASVFVSAGPYPTKVVISGETITKA